MSRRARRHAGIATGSRGCAYKTASGRHEWPNRDPIGERYDANLYRFVYNSPLNYVDPDGLTGWALYPPQGWSDPSIPAMIQSPEYQQGFQEGMGKAAVEGGSVLASIFIEPLDWAMTAGEIYNDPANPWSYAGIVPFVPSAAGKAGKKVCELTKLGHKGGKKWRDAMKLIQKGGDVNLGFTPTKAEALDMLREAGIDMKPPMFRVDPPHGPPSTHTYPHINYPTPGGGKGTIRIQ